MKIFEVHLKSGQSLTYRAWAYKVFIDGTLALFPTSDISAENAILVVTQGEWSRISVRESPEGQAGQL